MQIRIQQGLATNTLLLKAHKPRSIKDLLTWRCNIEISHEILPVTQFSLRYINWVLNMIFIEPWSQSEGTPRGTAFNERPRSCIVRASGINHDINDVWNKLNESFFRYRIIGENVYGHFTSTSSFCNVFQSGKSTEIWSLLLSNNRTVDRTKYYEVESKLMGARPSIHIKFIKITRSVGNLKWLPRDFLIPINIHTTVNTIKTIQFYCSKKILKTVRSRRQLRQY